MPKSNLKHIFIIPTLFLVLLLSIVLDNHIGSVQRQVNREYERIIDSLQRSIKVMISLDYNLSQLYKQSSGDFYNHNFELDEQAGLCVIRPSTDQSAVMANQDVSVPNSRLDYSIAGSEVLCEPSSELHEIASKKVILAPVISFIHDYEKYLHGIYFISKYDYIISSPKQIAENLTKQTLDTIYSRPYWKNSMNNKNQKHITFTPPYTDAFFDGLEVLTFSTPIYYKDFFKGVLVIDLSVEKLLRSNNDVSKHIQLLESDQYERFEQYRFMQPVTLEDTDFTYFLYYKSSIKEELISFLTHDIKSLTLIFVTYILAVLSMFYYQTHLSQRYYRDLAKQDPMTGLYNRRGFEMSLQDRVVKKYVGFALYDIDDFKQINDIFGHDVGDEAIIYVAKILNKSVRDSDIVSRFGGEEFVVCINAESRASLENICERVRKSIQDSSGKVVKGGFTVSGGVAVIDSRQDFSFEHVIKKADDLLYKAKQEGKNRVYFS
ncbi:diguanylate cyclase [Aliivibrio sp. S4TY2]|uniref:sensor domain-containing diguanylate cyclase n=1 Tax=unclassified Aliivibrio TaxID=2645654 RepID=UPI002378720D|nr:MULTISPECIES: sensor domain-containing diguanylate cyclase [unclassified Aliivibrio]MDD9158358.1 diguanylate cyclase [Aliivibrio sp. S4TY2]MDD9162352.1 diguanylate cyclase [Aliivibrio sp. S4TY1]MDD9166359.1 diguanylate cyclase [Aliivibrio sp. S4MY2]MDD9170357.1 diguanylate cyclase [Aliivibrio sp. S4MY4]MDD9187438.1 diguanylate cyclase [Aliivibrio sp. S4MY3]